MERNLCCHNDLFGDSGIGYQLFVLMVILPVFLDSWCLFIGMSAETEQLLSLICLSASILISIFVFYIIKVLIVLHNTVQQIEINDSSIRIKSFGSKELVAKLESCNFQMDREGMLDKAYLHAVFPDQQMHMILTFAGKRYYISSLTRNFIQLRDLILTRQSSS